MPSALRLGFVLAAASALLATSTLHGVEAQSDFDAAFEDPSGNEWWIQVYVAANEPLAGVDAEVDGGPWRALEPKSWGAWAESYHAPDGSVVRFRATSADGDADVSGCYRWTDATPTSCPEAGDPSAPTFDHTGGNEWWVEVDVHPFPDAVEAMDEGGPWRALTFRDWGEWAGSFHVEPGHLVRFRAAHDGAWTESCWFSHPKGEEVDCGGPVPPPPDDDPPVPPVPLGSRRVAAFGDTGVGSNAHANVAASLEENATGYLGLGDYYYWDPPSEWKDVFRPLTDRGAWLVLGNHDELPALAEHFPDGATWSASVNGARVVGVDTTRSMYDGSEQYAFARDALCGATEPFRVLAGHHPWWLEEGARHPGSEFPAPPEDMEALVATCGVDLVLVSHEHNYQRLMRGDVAYVVVGTGGQSLYPVQGAPEGTVASFSVYGRLLVDLNASGYVARFRTLDGETLDAFNGTALAAYAGPPPPPPPPAVTFDPRGGNEWWVEVDVEPFPSAVEAMDTFGTWRALTFRDWGNWAGSFRIEPGHEVRFRAAHDGAWTESCWFTHPEGVPTECGADDEFDAVFRDASGNEWWIQVYADANRPLLGVDARVDGGDWRPLKLRDWGAWAASYHAPEGSIVRFRATSTDGATDASGPYAWPPS